MEAVPSLWNTRYAGFNGAEACASEMDRRYDHRCWCCYSFNGAEACASEMGRRKKKMASHRSCFNGAEACASEMAGLEPPEHVLLDGLQWGRGVCLGNGHPFPVVLAYDVAASMGPRRVPRKWAAVDFL
jgi:hypothetical protein